MPGTIGARNVKWVNRIVRMILLMRVTIKDRDERQREEREWNEEGERHFTLTRVLTVPFFLSFFLRSWEMMRDSAPGITITIMTQACQTRKEEREEERKEERKEHTSQGITQCFSPSYCTHAWRHLLLPLLPLLPLLLILLLLLLLLLRLLWMWRVLRTPAVRM